MWFSDTVGLVDLASAEMSNNHIHQSAAEYFISIAKDHGGKCSAETLLHK